MVAGDRNIFFPRYFSNFYIFFKDRKKQPPQIVPLMFDKQNPKN